MRDKDFIKDTQKAVPNSKQGKMKEKTGLVRISEEALDLVRLQAFKNKITNKEYVEQLIFDDNRNQDNN